MKKNNTRIIHFESIYDAENEIKKLTENKIEIEKYSEKAFNKILKISSIDSRAANILKNEAISVGADVLFADDVYNFNTTLTDVIIFGNMRQLENLYYKLKTKPFELSKLAEKVKEILFKYDSVYEKTKKNQYSFNFNNKTHIMGILNITPDSFSDGGKFNKVDSALKQAVKLKKEGADIIDIGAESSRPGSENITEEEELDRMLPILERIIKEIEIPVSIDTMKSKVAYEALKIGAHIINDISGLKNDEKMGEVISDFDALAVLMHMQGNSKNMQNNPFYSDVTGDIMKELLESIEIANISGIKDENIIIDPGIGFGKTIEHNIKIIKNLKDFKSLGYPILVGASRKSFIGKILDAKIDERLEGSLAIAAASIINGASILRVHDVKETKQVIKMLDYIYKQEE